MVKPIFATSNVKNHPQRASVPITILLYNGPWLWPTYMPTTTENHVWQNVITIAIGWNFTKQLKLSCEWNDTETWNTSTNWQQSQSLWTTADHWLRYVVSHVVVSVSASPQWIHCQSCSHPLHYAACNKHQLMNSLHEIFSHLMCNYHGWKIGLKKVRFSSFFRLYI